MQGRSYNLMTGMGNLAGWGCLMALRRDLWMVTKRVNPFGMYSFVSLQMRWSNIVRVLELGSMIVSVNWGEGLVGKNEGDSLDWRLENNLGDQP